MPPITDGLRSMPSRELLAKAKELQYPRSLATTALAGLILYIRGFHDDKVREMLQEGITFCELCERDIGAYKSDTEYSFTPGGPRHYSPALVMSEPQGDLVPKVREAKTTLKSMLSKKSVDTKSVEECQRIIAQLVKPYREQASQSLADWKFGPMLRK